MMCGVRIINVNITKKDLFLLYASLVLFVILIVTIGVIFTLSEEQTRLLAPVILTFTCLAALFRGMVLVCAKRKYRDAPSAIRNSGHRFLATTFPTHSYVYQTISLLGGGIFGLAYLLIIAIV